MLHQKFYVVLIMYHFANLGILDYIWAHGMYSLETPCNITTVVFFLFFSFSLLSPPQQVAWPYELRAVL